MILTRRSRWMNVALLILCLCMVGGVVAHAKKGRPSKDPFNATFRNLPDRITDDGRGPYIDGEDGAHVRLSDGKGNFVIDPDRNARKKDVNRFFNLDLTDILPGEDPGTFALTIYQAGFMSVNGRGGLDADGNVCGANPTDAPPRDMRGGECTWANVAVNFSSGSRNSGFRLRCGRASNLNQAGTDEILVTCEDDPGNACTTWAVRPSVEGVLTCRVYEDVKNKTFTIADFNVPFGFAAVRQ